MIGFDRRSNRADGVRDVNMAQLFGPEVVFRHKNKASEGAQPPGSGDAPANLFDHLAVQGLERAFARIDTAAGQLDVRFRTHLAGQQNLPAPRQDRIGTGPQGIAARALGELADSGDQNAGPFQFLPLRLYRRDMPTQGV